MDSDDLRTADQHHNRKSYPPHNVATELARQLTLQNPKDYQAQSLRPGDPKKSAHVVTEGLSLENTMWANSVVTSGPVLAIAVYTGKETRAAMCRTKPSLKTGLFDHEVNFQSKILFWMLVLMALVLVIFKGLHGVWYLHFARFILLLSSIIPISLRVNMDMAKTYYSYLIMHDDKIPQTVVRTSTIPEELGRIDYLLTDKTGTLTRNNMVFKELHIGKAQFSTEEIAQMKHMLDDEFVGLGSDFVDPYNTTGTDTTSAENKLSVLLGDSTSRGRSKGKRLEVKGLLRQAVVALSLCHTVTPATDEDTGEVTYQAASPDEVALVKFASSVGLRLHSRNEVNIVLEDAAGTQLHFEILSCFPFSSETRRMGIIIKDSSGTIFFFTKGAEIAMIPKLQPRGSHWVLEECGNFARKGLRTLVVAQKVLTSAEYSQFRRRYDEAAASMTRRAESLRAVMNKLETDLELVALTGVEDMLQHDVPLTLESLRHAGIKIWMLTGDKVETATCIAISAGLKARQHSITYLTSEQVTSPMDLQVALEKFEMGLTDSILIVDGTVLTMCLSLFSRAFIAVACTAPSVVCCRCSPAQKADVVSLIKTITGFRTCAVGDGGNDVPMIQCADCGIGIVGNEGKQASLAADFSINHFHYVRRLLLWHGRNSFQRSSKLAQFVIHRGMIIAVMQAIFSAIFFFIPVAIFQGWLTVGYATYYTMWPVFSLVLDVESPESVVFMFPELYLTLKSGRDMSIKTFCSWIWKSVYQGSVIMMAALLLFEDRFINIVSIAFTSLILSELLNVISEINTWHRLMIVAQFVTILIYLLSMCLLKSYFDLQFIITGAFWWRVSVITVLSWLPVHIFKVVQKVLKPPQYSKLAA